MGHVVVKDVPEDVKRDFKALCREQGTTMTEALTQVMQKLTGHQEASPSVNREQKLTLRLSADELDALLERQRQECDTFRTTTAINALRRGLDGEPILNQELTHAVRESNRELASIGRNLNQVARALNADPGEAEHLRYEAIQELVGVIDGHRQKVAKTVQQSLNRSR